MANTTKTVTLKVDENGKVDLSSLQPNTHQHQKSIEISKDSIAIDSGSIYGDIVIMVVIGAVIVGAFFMYGYFFGTRNTEEKIAEAVKMDRIQRISDQINLENL